jgi:hypothetical protein
LHKASIDSNIETVMGKVYGCGLVEGGLLICKKVFSTCTGDTNYQTFHLSITSLLTRAFYHEAQNRAIAASNKAALIWRALA